MVKRLQTINTQSLSIDIKKRSLSSNFVERTNVSQYIPQFVQGDTNIVEATIKDGENDADLSNVGRIIGNFKRQDNEVISREATVSGNVVTYELGNEEMIKAGIGELELQFFNSDDTQRISSLRFKVNVMAEIGVGLEGADGPTLAQMLIVNGEHAKLQGDRAEQIADENKTRFLNAVTTVASRDSTYDNPTHGDTVRVTEEARSYRYVTGIGWVVTDEYNPTAIDEVNAQLAETAEVFNQTKSLEEVDVFLVYGQSNARGYAGNTPGDPTYKTNNVTIWDGTQEIPLTTYMPTQNDGNSTGNAWTAFSNEYARKTGRKAILANCAKGSQSVAELSKGAANTNYSGLVQWGNDIKSHIVNSGKTVGKTVILWCQGERDSADLTPTSQYKTALETLWTDIKTDIGADLFAIFTVGYYNDNRKIYAWAIQAVQRKFAKTNLDSIIAFDDIESLNAHGMKVDGVHLNQVGYNYMGERGAKSVVGTLFTDNSYQQEELIKRQGIVNLDGSQEWKYYGGWLTANGWQPSTSTSRATSNVIGVTVQSDHLAITLADRVDYILDVNAKFKDITSGAIAIGTGVKPVFDQKIYNSIDSEGRTVLKLYFLADLSIRANMTTQAIDTSLMGADFTSVLSASWGTGTLTITHPQTRKLSTAVSRDITTPFIIGCRGASTSTTIKSWNTSGTLANSEVVVDLKEILLSPSLLPTNMELTFSMVGTEKRDS
jgi:hypothetical protein